MEKEQNYTFLVSMSDTSNTKHEQKAFYNLMVKEKCLTLCDSWTNSLVLEWHYRNIRRYGRSPTTFTIDAGRRSESGDGVFEMKTSEAEEIMKRITEKTEKALDKDSAKDRDKQSRSHKALPPLPPPSNCEMSADESHKYINVNLSRDKRRSQQKSSYVNASHPVDADKESVFIDDGKVSIGVNKVHVGVGKVRTGVDRACIDVDKVRFELAKVCIGVEGVDRDPDSAPPAHQKRYVSMTNTTSDTQQGVPTAYVNITKDTVSGSGDYITPIPPKHR